MLSWKRGKEAEQYATAKEPIVTKEEFEQVQKLIAEKSPQMEKCRTNRGVYSDDLWRKKMRCQCGHAFAKTKWHSKKNFTTYTYKCYDQTRTGTVSARLKNGLRIEGICPVPLVQNWKMNTMGQIVLHAIFDDPEATLREAAAVLGGGVAGVEQAEVLRDKSIVEEQLKKEQGIKELEQQMLQYRDVKPATEADVNGKLEALSSAFQLRFRNHFFRPFGQAFP